MSELFELKISDRDINEKYQFSCDTYEPRPTAVGVVVNDKNEVGLVTNKVHNLLTLPGGGVKEGETYEEAFVREMREEIFADIERVELIGEINEQRGRDCKQYQTKVFRASSAGTNKPDTRTDNEKELGLKPRWLNIVNTEQVLKKQVKQVLAGGIDYYNTSFNIYRDTIILSEYIKKLS